MSRTATVLVTACCVLSVPAMFSGNPPIGKLSLHPTRQASTDLEVGGEFSNLPQGSTRYITYLDLLSLPQVTYTVSDDANFRGKTQISGIPLAQLARLVDASPQAKLLVAVCYDGYRTNYSSAYLTAHRPLLVLKINGEMQNGWPKTESGSSLGPYLISHPAFTPAFKVLSHNDEPQIPFGVVRIEFRNQETVLGAIAPPGSYPANSPVMDGYRIAQQNCFRCHNMGAEGGQMAGRNWQLLALWAAHEPQLFSRYVKSPQSVNPNNKMPGNPEYDAATVDALRQYFTTFAPAGKAASNQ